MTPKSPSASTSQRKRQIDIAIIGAGMAGASVARALQDAGRSVIVFDKSARAGGRMQTKRTSFGAFDGGAQYFTARDPRFQQAVQQWRDSGIVAAWQPCLAVIDEHGLQIKTADQIDRFIGTPTQHTVVDALLRDIDVQFSSTLTRIESHDNQFALINQHDALLANCQTLVICIPAPQAAQLLANYQMPQAYASQATMQPCWALLTEFAEPLGVDFDAAFVNHGGLSWIAREASKPMRAAGERWLIHANANFSTKHLEQDSEQGAELIYAEFASCLQRIGINVHKPRSMLAHRWRYALGGRMDGEIDAHYWHPADRIGLAGDWCAAGRVEGAYLSGLALARRILAG
jgi:renalase